MWICVLLCHSGRQNRGARLCFFLSTGVPGLWDILFRGKEMKPKMAGGGGAPVYFL